MQYNDSAFGAKTYLSDIGVKLSANAKFAPDPINPGGWFALDDDEALWLHLDRLGSIHKVPVPYAQTMFKLLEQGASQ